MSERLHYDVLVIGSGPAGQKAAIQGAKAGKRVALIERERDFGGACVHQGTIPSKTLRETALHLARLKGSAEVLEFKLRGDAEIASLMTQLDHVVKAHVRYITEQLTRNGIDRYHGRARFLSDKEIQLLAVDGSARSFIADVIVIATGSRPRVPDNIPIDHEHILDSDSILSMIYLPRTLTVLGGGVIACEYASMFALLGTQVTMIDQADRPLRFLDPKITNRFLQAFEKNGGTYLGQRKLAEVKWDGLAKVVTTVSDGQRVESDKMRVALVRWITITVTYCLMRARSMRPHPRGAASWSVCS